LGGDLGFLARRRDEYYGTPPPDGANEPEFIAWLDDMQMEWVRAARRLSPSLVMELLAWSGPQVIETLAAEDELARSATVSWAGPQPVPVWLDQLRELSECWIHRQQLLQAISRSSDLEPALVRPILLGLRWAYPYRPFQLAQAADGDSVRISITGPVTETWFLVASSGMWDFAAVAGPRTVASLAMTTDQAWRLLTNNLPHEARNDLDFAGDPGVVDVLWRTRAIIGDPK
jgi:hypothetical protein